MSVRSQKHRLKVPGKPNALSKKYRVVILLSFLFSHVVLAQRETIDSLKKVLPSLHDSARIDCLNALSGIYLKYYDALTAHFIPDTPKYYADVAYKESKRLSYVHGVAESLSYKGEFEFSHDHFPEAEKFSREALYWYKKTTNKKRLAETYFTFGRTLYAQSVFAEAIKNVDTSYMLYKENKNVEGMCWAVSLTAWIYEASGNHEKAFELARQSLNLAIKNNDDLHRRSQLSLIGDLFRDIEDYETALEYYRRSSKNAKAEALGYAELFTLLKQYDSAKYYYSFVDTTSPRIRRQYLMSIGEYYFEQKLYDKALPNFTRALDYHKQLNDRNPVMQTLVDIAKTYLAVGNDDSAFAYGNQSFILAKQTGARQVKKAACEILSAVYYHRHQGDSAYLYYKQYTSIKDSVLNDQVKGKLAAYTFEQKMELLNKEKQLQRVQLQKQSLLKNILIGGIIILLLLAAVIFRNILLKRRYEKQRLEQKLELQQLESKIESQQALLNERLRISRELHDDIGSTLGSISIYSEVAKKHTEKKEDTGEVLSKIGLASRELIDKMSDIVWSLNPNNESFEQLQNRMMTFAAMILSSRGILYHFIADERLKKMKFTGEQRKNIFLIFKEALHNIVKYAACKTVSITLSVKNNDLMMLLKDDGKGFKASEIEANEIFTGDENLGGNGIKNMYARAADMNAKLCIHSTINEGTTVQLMLHL